MCNWHVKESNPQHLQECTATLPQTQQGDVKFVVQSTTIDLLDKTGTPSIMGIASSDVVQE